MMRRRRESRSFASCRGCPCRLFLEDDTCFRGVSSLHPAGRFTKPAILHLVKLSLRGGGVVALAREGRSCAWTVACKRPDQLGAAGGFLRERLANSRLVGLSARCSASRGRDRLSIDPGRYALCLY